MDLLDQGQVDDIRRAFNDLADTFAFPVTVRRTTYVEGAFRSNPTVQDFPLKAIRDFGSPNETDRFRNGLGPEGTHEFNIFIGWTIFENAGLVGAEDKILLDHNDLVVMEGEVYEILAFGSVADMTKRPTFVQMRIKRRFQSPNGAAAT